MNAMVLAAGLGLRMRPLTWNRAKPTVPLLNRPSILHTVEYLARHGIEEIVINLHYLPESVRKLEPKIRELGIRVHFTEEPVLLGTAGGLKNAERFLKNGTLVMVNSDFVADCPLLLALDHHRKTGAAATMVLTPFTRGTEYGAVEMDDSGRVVRIAGRPGPKTGSPSYHFTGIHFLEPFLFDLIPSGSPSEINREIYPALIKSGHRISGYLHPGFWRELGSPARYLSGSLDLLEVGDAAYLQRMRVAEGIFCGTRFPRLHGEVTPPFLAGRELRMENGAKASGLIAGDGVTLGSGSITTRCVLWDGVRVDERASLRDCVAGVGARIPAGSRFEKKILLDEVTYGGDREGLEAVGPLLVAPLTGTA